MLRGMLNIRVWRLHCGAPTSAHAAASALAVFFRFFPRHRSCTFLAPHRWLMRIPGCLLFGHLAAGLSRYVVPFKWWSVMSAYVGLDGNGSSGVPPQEINNGELLDPDFTLALKKGLVSGPALHLSPLIWQCLCACLPRKARVPRAASFRVGQSKNLGGLVWVVVADGGLRR